MPEVTRQPVRTALEELRFLAAANGSYLFAFNALVPLYPIGRLIFDGPRRAASEPATALTGLAIPFLGSRPIGRAQAEALVVAVATVVAALFLVLYVLLLVDALSQLQPKGG